MTRALLVAIALLACVTTTADARGITVTFVNQPWKADAKVHVNCKNVRSVAVRVADNPSRARLRVYRVKHHWQADMIICIED